MSDTVEMLGGKWKLLILALLSSNEALRFNELERILKHITPRMLSKELKTLEEHQLIDRQEVFGRPVKVTYRLTEYGKTLEPVLFALGEWGKVHRKQLMES